ncbi:MAG: SDR family oxidoreductase [Dyadobacter sp.]|uniref:SDR family oxidoreductase n=1 Tax=Dyadobacter sp. TaxID=1914288 RepID=UPI003264F5CE
MESVNLSGKVVVITGASSGIGKAIAKYLASQGVIVSLGARRMDKLIELQDQITIEGGKAAFFLTDVTQKESVDALIKHTLEIFGKVDVIINNAGVMLLSKLEELRYEEWDAMISTNLKGMLYGIGAALPYFKARKEGHFINISSLSGHRVDPTSAVYSATKYAVRALSEGLRQEVKLYNIRSTIISPGIIQSELTQAITDAYSKEMVKGMESFAISADAVAHAVAYAISQPQDVDISEMIIRPTAQPY